jgi:predicted DNA-binding ribbon-helix-helix protein
MDRSGLDDKTKGLEAYLSSPVVKRSVMIAGHATSVSLERPFWDELGRIALSQGRSVNALIAEIDETKATGNLSSALRLFVLHTLSIEANRPEHL